MPQVINNQKPPDLDLNGNPIGMDKPPDLDLNGKPIQSAPKKEEGWGIQATPSMSLGRLWRERNLPLVDLPGSGLIEDLTSPMGLVSSAASAISMGAAGALPKAAQWISRIGSLPIAAEGMGELFGKDKTVSERVAGLGETVIGGLGVKGGFGKNMARAESRLPIKKETKLLTSAPYYVDEAGIANQSRIQTGPTPKSLREQLKGVSSEAEPRLVGKTISPAAKQRLRVTSEGIPVVNRASTPADYATDIAHMKARGQEVPPGISELAKPTIEAALTPKLTPDVQSYIKGMKEGTIKKGVTFDNWKQKLIEDETGAIGSDITDARADRWQAIVDELDAQKASDYAYRDILSTGGKTSLKKGQTWRNEVLKYIRMSRESTARIASESEPSLISRLVSEEEATYTPGRIISNLRKKYGEKKIQSVRNDVINTLVQGGRLDLNGIMQKAAKAGIPKKDFNKIIDNIIDSDELKTAVNEINNRFQSIADPVEKFKAAIQAAKPLREEQELLYSQERSERIGKFASVKERGEAGFRKRLSMLGGEYEKVVSSPLKLDQVDRDALKDMIVDSRLITEFEKARAGVAIDKVLSGKALPQKNELALLDRVFGPDLSQSILELHGGLGVPGKIGVNILKTANTMKTMKTTGDISAGFRQGAGLLLRKEFWTAFRDQFKMFGSEDAFKAHIAEIQSRPTYLTGRNAGLFINDELVKLRGKLTMREEHFLHSYIDDIRGSGKIGKIGTEPVRASERAFTGFLNQLRQDTFDNMLKDALKLGLKEDTVAPLIAKYINTATGRGSLGAAAKYGDALNALFFSPRLIASRLQTLNPLQFVGQPKLIVKEQLKTLASITGLIATVNTLGYIAGARLTSNPLSADFGKPTLGRTRTDPGAGFLQYITAYSRFLKNAYTTAGGETRELGKSPVDPTRMSLLFGIGGRRPSFTENKFSPFATFIREILTGRDNLGNEIPASGLPAAFVEKFIPMIVENFADLAEEDPKAFPFPPEALIIPDAMGIGVNTYEEQEPSSSMGLRAPSMSLRP